MNCIKLQFLGISEFAKPCNSSVYTQLVISLRPVWKFPDSWRDLPQFSSKLDFHFQKAGFSEFVLCCLNLEEGGRCWLHWGGGRCALRALPGYYSYISTELRITSLLKKKKISFPLVWKEPKYPLWAVLWGFMVWPALPTLLSWAVSFCDPLTCGPVDVVRGARLLSLRTNSWFVALALSSSALVAHSKIFIMETIGHLAFQGTHRRKKKGDSTISVTMNKNIHWSWCQGWWSRFPKSVSPS